MPDERHHQSVERYLKKSASATVLACSTSQCAADLGYSMQYIVHHTDQLQYFCIEGEAMLTACHLHEGCFDTVKR